MNIDTLAGESTDMKGRLKTGLGNATNDPALTELPGTIAAVSGHLTIAAARHRGRRSSPPPSR